MTCMALSACLTMAAQDFVFNHGPYLQNPGTDEMTVFFTTSKNAFSWVEVKGGEWAEPQVFAPRSEGLIEAYNTANAIRITGLQPNTEYAYRLVSKEMTKFQPYSVTFGETITSGWETFRTLDPKAKEVTFLMVNDGHGDSGKLRKLLETFPLDEVDIVFYNGDMISYYDDATVPYSGFLDVSTELFAKNKPFVYVRGNHETRGNLARSYKSLVGTPNDRFYNLFFYGNTAFVLLDTGEDKPDTTPVYAGINDFDGYRTEQAQWFRTEVLKSKAFRKAKHKVALMHIPPLVTPGIPAGEEHGNAQLNAEIAPLFNKAGLDLSLHGHTHQYYSYDKGEQGCQFPVLVNDNHSAMLVKITDDGIYTKIINDKGEVLHEKTY